MDQNSPIVVLDSGLGGLTVVRALRAALPYERVIYFGDTAHLPYGNKSQETITALVKRIVRYLERFDPKHVVIACNTATALSLNAVRQAFPDLFFSGVIDPGAKAAISAAGVKPAPAIGVIATEGTIRSRAYERAILRRRTHARTLLQPTPLLVPMIEEGRSRRDPLVRMALQQYLAPMIENEVDVLVLGCTHYPVYKPLVKEIMGDKVRVIDSAEQCANDVAARLRSLEMLCTDRRAPEATLSSFVTDDPARFARLAKRFLGQSIELPTLVSVDELHAASAGREEAGLLRAAV